MARTHLEPDSATLRSVTSFALNSYSQIYQQEFPVTNWQTFVVAQMVSVFVDMSADGAERFPVAQLVHDFLEGNKGSLVKRFATAGDADAASDSVG